MSKEIDKTITMPIEDLIKYAVDDPDTWRKMPLYGTQSPDDFLKDGKEDFVRDELRRLIYGIFS